MPSAGKNLVQRSFVTWSKVTGRRDSEERWESDNYSATTDMGDLTGRSRKTLCCLAIAFVGTLSGCQAPSTPSSKNGSPFSEAATYNRQNTSDMGLTIYDGTSHDKPSTPPSTPPVPPSSGNCPQGTNYPANRPVFANPPVSAPGMPVSAPGMAGPAPIGYWVYQPAAGYPAVSQSGFAPVIPVYGPPAGGMPGNTPAMPGGGPMSPAVPVQPGPYAGGPATNYPAMAPGNGPVSPTWNGNGSLPPTAAAGSQPVDPRNYPPPVGNPPQTFGSPSYTPASSYTPGNSYMPASSAAGNAAAGAMQTTH